MANPQPTDAHLRVAHSISEAIMLRDFSKRQRKILDLILRLSWGCGKKIAIIPRQRDFVTVGIGEGHIQTELSWLVESLIITRDGSAYSFNKDFEQWQVSRVKPYEPRKLTELVRLNLNNNKPLSAELTKTGSLDLPKREVSPYQKGKLATPKPVSSKERLKKALKKEDKSSSKKITITSDEIAEIATLYDVEIGKISPVAAQALNDACQQYPAQDIKDAIKEAVLRGKRNWKYIEAILRNKKAGKRKGEGNKYLHQKYGHMVRR